MRKLGDVVYRITKSVWGGSQGGWMGLQNTGTRTACSEFFISRFLFYYILLYCM